MQVYRYLDLFCSYAVALFTNLPLLDHKVRTDELLVSITDFVSIKLEDPGGGWHTPIMCSLKFAQSVIGTVWNWPSFTVFNLYEGPTGIIVGATLGLVLAVVIVGFAVFCWRRFVTALLMAYSRWDHGMELNSLFPCCRLPRKESTDVHIHSIRYRFCSVSCLNLKDLVGVLTTNCLSLLSLSLCFTEQKCKYKTIHFYCWRHRAAVIFQTLDTV